MAMVSAVNSISHVQESKSSSSEILGELNFRSRNGIGASSNIRVTDSYEVEWNEVCKTSYKWDVYPKDIRDGHIPSEPSYLTFDIDLSQMDPQARIELKFFGCTREYVGQGLLSFEINGSLAADKVAVYDGPDFNLPPHLAMKNDGKAFDHLDETSVDITAFVQKGMNRIQVKLHPESESGVSIRWIEIVQSN